MKRKYFLFFCFIFIFPMISFGKVTCNIDNYNAVIDLEKSEITLDETTNINVSSDSEYKVFYSVSNEDVINISKDGLITAHKIGSSKINIKIDFYDGDSIHTCNSEVPFKVLSSDTTLKSLNIEEFDISSEFKSDKYNYEIKLPYNYDKINIIAVANDETATISGDGRQYLNENNNEFEILVKSTDGKYSTYKITVLREEPNGDTTLKNLIVEGFVLSPTFSKDELEYNLNVSKDVDEIVIKAEPSYEYSKVEGIGIIKLATGENKIPIKVTSEDENELTYIININKSSGNAYLKTLEIKNIKLNEKFNENVFTYTAILTSNIDKLDILATGNDDDKIEIIGNEDLKYGKNNIIIKVTNKDNESTTYKIILNKITTEEEKEIEKNNKLLNFLLLIFVVSIIIMFIFIFIFLKKNYLLKKFKKTNILKKKKRNN